MNPQQLTNERFLSDIKSLNKTIEAQAAEIASLNAQIERMAGVMVDQAGQLVKADEEIAKLRALLREWFELGPEFDIQDGQNYDVNLVIFESLDKRTEEALK